MNKRIKPVSLVLAAVLAGAAFLVPQEAHAGILGWVGELTGISDVAFSLVQKVAYYIAYLIGILLNIITIIEVFFFQFLLKLNFDLVNSTSVQFGFSIVLAFANIAFVAAVIIMAVATIIRYDTYGAKQLLWKIVIAAIGVNFSLILAGTAINFSDRLTEFFINNSVPNPTADIGVGILEFADNLAGAFNPQKAFLNAGFSTEVKEETIFSDATSKFAADTAGMFAAIAGIYMTVIMSILLVIFFGIMLAAFAARYVTLSLLLIIMPAVWLAWIFPFGRGLVSYWSDKFVKWTFFAPMAMFFLYLSMKTAAFINGAHVLDDAQLTGLGSADTAGGGISGFLFKTFGAAAKPIITSSLNFILISGTLYGGLYFSSKLGIKFMDSGKAAFASVGNSVKRRASAAGMRTLDRVRTSGKDKDGNSRLQRMGSRLSTLSSNSRIARMAGAGTVGRYMADAGVANKKSVEQRVQDEQDSLKNLTTSALLAERRRLASGQLAANPDREAAIFKLLKEKKALGGLATSASPEVEKALADYEKKAKADGLKGKDLKKAVKEEKKRLQSSEQYKKVEEAYKKDLERQLKRAQDSGVLKEILPSAPQLAALAPRGKTKDKSRTMTTQEAVAAQIPSVKGDDISTLALDDSLFDYQKDEGLETRQGVVLRTTALNNSQLKQIGDMNIEQIERITEVIERARQKIQKFEALSEEKKKEIGLFGDFFYNEDSNVNLTSEQKTNRISIKDAKTRITSMYKTLKNNVNFTGRIDTAKMEQLSKARRESRAEKAKGKEKGK